MVMKERTTEAVLTLIAVLVGAIIGVLIMANVAYAADTCPEEGKVEAVADELDDIVLDAGTEVCIKGGQVLVNVTADGVSTLKELLGNFNDNGELRSVSHYTITKEVPPSTTTTTVPETTTTSTPSTTTSSTEPVTPTTVESTTTTTPAVSSTTTVETSSTTTVPSTSPSTPEPPSEELPFTGVPGGVLLATASLLLAGGVATLIRERLSSE